MQKTDFCELDNDLISQIVVNKGPAFLSQALNVSETCIRGCIDPYNPSYFSSSAAVQMDTWESVFMMFIMIYMLFMLRISLSKITRYFRKPVSTSRVYRD